MQFCENHFFSLSTLAASIVTLDYLGHDA